MGLLPCRRLWTLLARAGVGVESVRFHLEAVIESSSEGRQMYVAV